MYSFNKVHPHPLPPLANILAIKNCNTTWFLTQDGFQLNSKCNISIYGTSNVIQVLSRRLMLDIVTVECFKLYYTIALNHGS